MCVRIALEMDLFCLLSQNEHESITIEEIVEKQTPETLARAAKGNAEAMDSAPKDTLSTTPVTLFLDLLFRERTKGQPNEQHSPHPPSHLSRRADRRNRR